MPSANPKRRISKHSVVEVDEVELRLDRDPVDVADDDAFMHHKFQDGSRLIGYVINDPSPCHPLNDSDGDG